MFGKAQRAVRAVAAFPGRLIRAAVGVARRRLVGEPVHERWTAEDYAAARSLIERANKEPS